MRMFLNFRSVGRLGVLLAVVLMLGSVLPAAEGELPADGARQRPERRTRERGRREDRRNEGAGARGAVPREDLFKDVEGLTRHFDVVYGKEDSKLQVLDAYIVKSGPGLFKKPSPVLMQYHAGGYIGGNKSTFTRGMVRKYETFLKAGISLVSCHYRLAPKYKFPVQLHDTGRSIQFVRSMAKEWNIDPKRIATCGGSAGGHLATWIALAPDLAKPDSKDPVARESSRVCCFIGCGPLYMRNMKPLPVQVLKVFGCTRAQWDKPNAELQKRIEYATPAAHLTKDDPPGMLHYMKPPYGLQKGQDFSKLRVPEFWTGPHDTWHGIKLAREMEKKGVPVVRFLGRTASASHQLDFLKKHFRMK